MNYQAYDYTKKPWELNSLLSEEVVQKIATKFQETQSICIEERLDRNRGDSDYSFGHTVRAWRIKALKEMKKSGELDGLRIILDKGNRFEFAIYDTALKFYSGSPDNLGKNIFKKTSTESAGQYQLNLFNNPAEPLYWRFIVQSTPNTHEYIATYVLAFNNSLEKVCIYKIDKNFIPTPYNPEAEPKEAIQLPVPVFTKKHLEEKVAK